MTLNRVHRLHLALKLSEEGCLVRGIDHLATSYCGREFKKWRLSRLGIMRPSFTSIAAPFET